MESPRQGPPPSQHAVYEPTYTRGQVSWPSIQLTPVQLSSWNKPMTLYLHRLTTRSAWLGWKQTLTCLWPKNRLFKVNTSWGPAGRSSFISGELKDGLDSMGLWLTGALLWPPQNATLDSKRTLSWFVSYRRLSSQFQFSLSAVILGYLSQWNKLQSEPVP